MSKTFIHNCILKYAHKYQILEFKSLYSTLSKYHNNFLEFSPKRNVTVFYGNICDTRYLCSVGRIPSCSYIRTNLINRWIHSKTFSDTGLSDVSSNRADQCVPRTVDEAKGVFKEAPISTPNSRLLKIAIIGAPNSGKSTLINKLIGWRICSVSEKVHTTRCSTRAVYNDDNTQLVFLDTPGIVTPEEAKKYRLKNSLVMDPELSLQKANIIAILQDVSNKYTRYYLHPRILRLLTLYPSIPSILIFNKVDRLKKKEILLDLTNRLTDSQVGGHPVISKSNNEVSENSLRYRLLATEDLNDKHSFNAFNESSSESTPNRTEFEINSREQSKELESSWNNFSEQRYEWDVDEEDSTDSMVTFEQVLEGKLRPTEKQVQRVISGKISWPKFSNVFMISALNGSGVQDLRDYLLDKAADDPWMFSDDMVTDQSPQEIALLAVREKCLENLNHNIPYELKFRIMYWDLSESDVISILIGAYCRRKSNLKFLIGPGGKTVKKISMEAEQALRNTFRTEIRLKINFMCDPNIKEL